LQLILEVLKGRPIILIIDETGDKKKGNTTVNHFHEGILAWVIGDKPTAWLRLPQFRNI
jgi:hypothetical protein